MKNAVFICLIIALGAFAVICSVAFGNGKNYRLPLYESYEATQSFTDLYGSPESVRIDGYGDDCMEPFVTSDGSYLFFNDSNSAEVQTHIHIARRSGKLSYKHLGMVPGTVSPSKDMAPCVDASGNFYFTTLRSFSKDGHSLYVGKLAGEAVSDVKVVPGDISPGRPGWINMDCDISSDGKTLYISRARFAPGAPAPHESDLVIAREVSGKFELDRLSDVVLKNVNTAALEYAPAISNNGLELFFTRAGELMVAGKNTGASLRIMVARRNSAKDPFGKPEVIKSIEGFVEAPTLTGDLSELFFHKKDSNGRLSIYRAVRKRP